MFLGPTSVLYLSAFLGLLRLVQSAPVTKGPLWVGVQMFSDLNMNGDEITWNATQPLYQGQSSPVYNLPGPFTARSLVYYALLDGLNGSEQYYGAILLKLYEQPDAQGAHKFAYFSPGSFTPRQHYFNTAQPERQQAQQQEPQHC